jgi:hypothetical protein
MPDVISAEHLHTRLLAQARVCIPTTVCNSHRGLSLTAQGGPGGCHRWAPSVTATTAPSSIPSGAECKPNSSTGGRWNTRIELARAIFDCLEIFHNRQRRHSALGMRISDNFEGLHQTTQPVACNPTTRLQETWGTSKSPDSPGVTVGGRCQRLREGRAPGRSRINLYLHRNGKRVRVRGQCPSQRHSAPSTIRLSTRSSGTF